MLSQVKKYVKQSSLYNPLHHLWIHRPNLRAICLNFGYRILGAPDDLPIPPDYLIFLVAISREVAWYLHSGNMCYLSILYALQKNGLQVENFEKILDFGCGCGRVIRHWKLTNKTQLFGTDYNQELINWCSKRLANIAQFNVNQLNPPLSYEDNQFDLVYLVSVFTHLPEQTQIDWMNEFARIIKPGKYLLLTLHGESRILELDQEDQNRFNSGQIVIKQKDIPGSNIYSSYHPYNYVVKYLAKDFEVIDHIPQGVRDANQDIYILRKL
jgi:ubiquinone/menaquinone biosynthesis C-methylase UbiE